MSKESLKLALEALKGALNHGDFSNGVTDPTGTVDEGVVRAIDVIQPAIKALEEALANEDADAEIIKYHEATIARLQEALAKQEQGEPVAHCEAGPNYCWKCLEEAKPTYGSEEIRKLREVIASQAKIIEDHIPDAKKMVKTGEI